MLKNIGYIEGFYESSSLESKEIHYKNLSELNFNSYFYAPRKILGIDLIGEKNT